MQIKSSPTTKLATSALLFAAATTVSAQSYGTGPAPAAGPGMVNEWLRKQSDDFKAWDIGGQFRVRYEMKDNFGTSQFGGAAAGANDFKKITLNPDTGSDKFGFYATRKCCELTEKVYGDEVRLELPTFSATADMAALSRAMGGYHIPIDNDIGLKVGRELAIYTWPKFKAYFNGTAPAPKP